MAQFIHLEAGNPLLDTGDEFFTPSRVYVDPQIPVLALGAESGDDIGVYGVGSIHVNDGADDWFLYPDEYQNTDAAAPPDQRIDDAWQFDDDAATAIVPSGYQQVDEPMRTLDDAWAWEFDEAGHVDQTMELAVSAEPTGADLPPVDATGYDFQSEDAYEDPTTDLLAGAFDPVMPNAPPLELAASHEWDFEEEPASLGVDDDYQRSDELYQPPQEDWPADDGFDEPPADDPIGADAPPPLTQEWLEEFEHDDWWHGLDALTSEDAPALFDADWDWTAADDDTLLDELALGADVSAPTIAAEHDWDWDADAPQLFPISSSYQQADELQPVPQADWFDTEVSDEAPEDSAPVGPDVLLASAIADPEWIDDTLDEFIDDSAPVADAPNTELAPQLDIDWTADEPALFIVPTSYQQADAAQLPLQLFEDPLFDAEVDDDFFDDFGNEELPGPALPEEVWFDHDAFEDLIEGSEPVSTPPNTELAPQTDIDWGADEPQMLIVPSGYQQADAVVLPIQLFDDPSFEVEVDDDFFDDFGNEEIPNAELALQTDWDWTADDPELLIAPSSYQQSDVAQLPGPAAEETWFDSDAFEDVHEGSAPVGADAPLNPELASQFDLSEFFAVDVEDDGVDDFGNEDVPAVPQDDPDFALDVGDDWIEPSAPVIPDAQQAAAGQPPEDAPLFEADIDDAWLVDEFLNADEVQPIPADAWIFDDQADEDLPPDPFLNENAPEDAAIADAPTFDDDAEDPPPLDEYRNENEPDPPPADGWDWHEQQPEDDTPLVEGPALSDNEPITFNEEWSPDEDFNPDDWWHADIQHPLVDFVPLPGPVYEEAWDFDVDTNDHDAWWANLTTPDTDGSEVDQCPILLAEAYARIAELEAELAECRKHQGEGGGGGASGDGDDIDHGHRHNRDHDGEQRDILRDRERERDEKKRRIEQQNAMLMALAGALVHGLKKGPPK